MLAPHRCNFASSFIWGNSIQCDNSSHWNLRPCTDKVNRNNKSLQINTWHSSAKVLIMHVINTLSGKKKENNMPSFTKLEKNYKALMIPKLGRPNNFSCPLHLTGKKHLDNRKECLRDKIKMSSRKREIFIHTKRPFSQVY